MRRILLIDHDDPRRATRVMVLEKAGYEVTTANHFDEVEMTAADAFDLVLLETDDIQKAVIAYAERLKAWSPKLSVLMLSNNGMFLPKWSLLAHFKSAHPSPTEVVAKIAALLLESSYSQES